MSALCRRRLDLVRGLFLQKLKHIFQPPSGPIWVREDLGEALLQAGAGRMSIEVLRGFCEKACVEHRDSATGDYGPGGQSRVTVILVPSCVHSVQIAPTNSFQDGPVALFCMQPEKGHKSKERQQH